MTLHNEDMLLHNPHTDYTISQTLTVTLQVILPSYLNNVTQLVRLMSNYDIISDDRYCVII